MSLKIVQTMDVMRNVIKALSEIGDLPINVNIRTTMHVVAVAGRLFISYFFI